MEPTPASNQPNHLSVPPRPEPDLRAETVERFIGDGYLAPIRVLTDEEAEMAGAAVVDLMTANGGSSPPQLKHKLHLVYNWADGLVHHPAILNAVEAVLGPDIVCWTSNLMVKPAQHCAFVSWHQDSLYWGLEPSEVVTAWVALTPSEETSGCVQVLPGSHLQPRPGPKVPVRKTSDWS